VSLQIEMNIETSEKINENTKETQKKRGLLSGIISNKSTLLYSLQPYSWIMSDVKKKMEFDKIDPILKKGNIALYPHSLNVKNVIKELDKTVAFIPYCAKPMEVNQTCPTSNQIKGRKNQKCLCLSDEKCSIVCSVGKMITMLKTHGFTNDQIFICDNDSNLLKWLKQKREAGYKHIFPGVACFYGIGCALKTIGEKLGYDGCIILLEDYHHNDKKNGVCRNLTNYLSMEKYDKMNKTRINNESIVLTDYLLSGKFVGIQPHGNISNINNSTQPNFYNKFFRKIITILRPS
jgi:hypothetical protein